MIEQMAFTTDGRVRGKIEAAIERLRCFEPAEGYYVAFSGGKDSQVVYHLCEMAGVAFDAHYAVTSVDPPELVQFIKEHYPDAWAGRVRQYEDGKPVTMWSLIEKKLMPPTRVVRYCCEKLKEANGEGRIVVTGVRWAEGVKRKESQGVVTIPTKSKRIKTLIEGIAPSTVQESKGGVILNDDNDEARRAVEHCYRTNKTLLNPIVDWLDEEVWSFLNDVVKVPHCSLYDEGMKRLGCIGCPMSYNKCRELERWPKYRAMYLRAFEKMLKHRQEAGLPC